ncbi:MAG: peptidase S10 [Planctomyces sp.]|nr:peptidase S10 [Planctomyces sp.]
MAPLVRIEREPSVTHSSVQIGGERVDYQAVAGTLPLFDAKGEAKANVFYIAYTRQGVRDPATRPVVFAFNGGPGSSSVWLHMGALGPRRVLYGPEGEMLPPPGKLVSNEHSWLDVADLVFIDPVSTGYSRAVKPEDAKAYHGLQEDIEAVAEFIRIYLGRHNRWLSPKFLCGESYGGVRGAGLARSLQGMGVELNGILFVSPAIDFATLRFDDNNDLPYTLYLPTYTATAWHHKKLGEDLQRDLDTALRESERFALTEYAAALAQGSGLSQEAQEQTARKLARLTGLSAGYILQSNLRVPISGFAKELLRDEGRTVGRFDSRYKGIDRVRTGDRYDYDPSYSIIQGPFTATFNHYVRAELGHQSDLEYEILTGAVQPWNYGAAENRYASNREALRAAMTSNPHLKVLVMGGYFDMATPYFASAYTADHLGLDPSLAGNVSRAWYKAGHMMYIRLSELEKFKRDAAAFIRAASPR